MNSLARDKITIFDRNLPRIAMRLVHLRRYHAKMLRRYASSPNFNSEQLTVRIKAREGSRTYEFSGLTGFLDYLQDPQNETPDALELSYQYAKVVHLPNGASDVAIMNSSVLFGEAGRNECYITSNDESWASEMHAFIKQDFARHKITNWGRVIKNTAFVVAAASLIVFWNEVLSVLLERILLHNGCFLCERTHCCVAIHVLSVQANREQPHSFALSG